jgi:Pyruvate/2-oxoacid:ferredoxin oxidoreductase delta subunit
MFRNYHDVLRFYLFGARLTRVPLIGPILARPILSEYGILAHGGVALPLSEIEKVIDQADEIVAGECPCRTMVQKCDSTKQTCLKLNTAGKVLLETLPDTSRRISREEAKAIAAESWSRKMLLQLEWCISPFHYDICCCCDCCCTARKLRFEYGVSGAIRSGPFVPHISKDACTECLECANICPADAIAFSSAPLVSIEKCVGCGLCESVCPSSAIEMMAERGYRQRKPVAGFGLFLWGTAITLVLVPMVLVFKLFFNQAESSSGKMQNS